MNELYTAYMSNPINRPVQRPINKAAQVMQAMRNPMGVIMQAFPDIPSYMQHNPGQMLQYLKQTRNISDEQIQNIMNQIPRY